MEKNLPLNLDRETLGQLGLAQLVEIIIEQALAAFETKPENFRTRARSRKTQG